MNNDDIDQIYNISELFKKLKKRTFKQKYNKTSIMKMFSNKKKCILCVYKTRGKHCSNLNLHQQNT